MQRLWLSGKLPNLPTRHHSLHRQTKPDHGLHLLVIGGQTTQVFLPRPTRRGYIPASSFPSQSTISEVMSSRACSPATRRMTSLPASPVAKSVMVTTGRLMSDSGSGIFSYLKAHAHLSQPSQRIISHRGRRRSKIILYTSETIEVWNHLTRDGSFKAVFLK